MNPLTVGRAHRFGFLLAAMCAELILAPLIAAAPGGIPIARALTLLVLLAGLVAVRARRVAVGLFVVAAVTHLVAAWSGSARGTEIAAVMKLVFLSYVCWRIIRHVLADREVTVDTIAGTACAYMLLGLIWGVLFFLVERWRPGSFEIPSGFLAGFDLEAALTYFSFATLTTLGYGTIHPADPAAGGLSVAEAIVGQLYLAVMIARMVGLHTARRAG
jgi:hypothetical protein